MKTLLTLTGIYLCLTTTTINGQETPGVYQQYEQIIADYRKIRNSTDRPAIRESAARLTRDAYRLLLQNAGDDLDGDDLYALGQCHEALGEFEKAKDRFADSIALSPSVRSHLGIVRVSLPDDTATAEEHFAGASELDPNYPAAGQFHLLFGSTYQNQRNWDDAIAHFERYLEYAKSLSDNSPGNLGRAAQVEATRQRLHDLKIFKSLTDNPAPAWEAKDWIQGEPVELAELAGSVVILDFFATWADSSVERMSQLTGLSKVFEDKPVSIIGVSLHLDDEDEFTSKSNREGIAAFAKRYGITWPLATVSHSTTDQYGVSTVPHTVVIDKTGNVRMILQTVGESDADEMSTFIEKLLAE